MHSGTPSNQIKREILKTQVRGKVKRCFHLVNKNPPKNCRGSEVNELLCVSYDRWMFKANATSQSYINNYRSFDLEFPDLCIKKRRIINRVLFQITFYSVHIIFSNCLEQVKESMKTDRERKKENRNEESADSSFFSLVLSNSRIHSSQAPVLYFS